MKSYCIIDKNTNKVFKVLLTKKELEDYLSKNKHLDQCINCIECDDAPSITLE